MKPRLAEVAWICLGDDEFGNEVMERVAREAFLRYACLDAVHVVEHGGWYLMFDRDLNCVGTANDQARMTPERDAFWRKFNDFAIVLDARRGKGDDWPELDRRRMEVVA